MRGIDVPIEEKFGQRQSITQFRRRVAGDRAATAVGKERREP